ncbi:MAG: hypothetical protein J5916_11090 [Oscillospiraceae bacterium]|nr:hypothetical protein [Oscillospiraceae bacterium]
MMKTLMRKLKNKSGVSLAEMLITILILLMVSSVVAGGVPVAVRAYQNAVDAANAYSLLSTTVNALRSEFSTAWGVDVLDKNTVVYYSARTGAKTKLYIEDGIIMVKDYLQFDTSDNDALLKPSENKPYGLVTKTGGEKKDILHVSCELAVPSSDSGEPAAYIEFNNLEVYKEKTPITSKKMKLVVRILNPEFSGPEYWVPQSSTGG